MHEFQYDNRNVENFRDFLKLKTDAWRSSDCVLSAWGSWRARRLCTLPWSPPIFHGRWDCVPRRDIARRPVSFPFRWSDYQRCSWTWPLQTDRGASGRSWSPSHSTESSCWGIPPEGSTWPNRSSSASSSSSPCRKSINCIKRKLLPSRNTNFIMQNDRSLKIFYLLSARDWHVVTVKVLNEIFVWVTIVRYGCPSNDLKLWYFVQLQE